MRVIGTVCVCLGVGTRDGLVVGRGRDNLAVDQRDGVGCLSRGAVELGSGRVDAQTVRAAAVAQIVGCIPQTLTDISFLRPQTKATDQPAG